MTDQVRKLDVGFPSEKSASEWERRHTAGEVPGRWPYGLDGLAAFASARAIELPPPSRAQRALARFKLGPRADSGAIGVTWDENSALRMATTRRHSRNVSGVIWLTDGAARGRDLGRLPQVLAECAALWVLSSAQCEPLRQLVPGVPVEHVRFGIDHEFFSFQPYPSVPRVVSVGGDRDRDTATLFKALELVHESRPDAELVVQTASDLSPPEGVTTFRYLPHLALKELYASAAVVAIATRPNLHVSGMTVSLEAMATGRPVVETRTPGMDDYVVDGETGLLTEPSDAEALAARVLELLDDPVRAAEMGEAGRRDVEQRFTAGRMSEAIYDVISRSV